MQCRTTPRQSTVLVGVGQRGGLGVGRDNRARGARSSRENVNNHRNNLINDRSLNGRRDPAYDVQHGGVIRDDLNNSRRGTPEERNRDDNIPDDVDHVDGLRDDINCCDNFRDGIDHINDLCNDFNCMDNFSDNVGDVGSLRNNESRCVDVDSGDLCNDFNFSDNNLNRGADDFADGDRSYRPSFSLTEQRTSPSLLCKMAACVQPMCPSNSPEFYPLDALPQLPPFGPPKHAWGESAESNV